MHGYHFSVVKKDRKRIYIIDLGSNWSVSNVFTLEVIEASTCKSRIPGKASAGLHWIAQTYLIKWPVSLSVCF